MRMSGLTSNHSKSWPEDSWHIMVSLKLMPSKILMPPSHLTLAKPKCSF